MLALAVWLATRGGQHVNRFFRKKYLIWWQQASIILHVVGTFARNLAIIPAVADPRRRGSPTRAAPLFCSQPI